MATSSSYALKVAGEQEVVDLWCRTDKAVVPRQSV